MSWSIVWRGVRKSAWGVYAQTHQRAWAMMSQTNLEFSWKLKVCLGHHSPGPLVGLCINPPCRFPDPPPNNGSAHFAYKSMKTKKETGTFSKLCLENLKFLMAVIPNFLSFYSDLRAYFTRKWRKNGKIGRYSRERAETKMWKFLRHFQIRKRGKTCFFQNRTFSTPIALRFGILTKSEELSKMQSIAKRECYGLGLKLVFLCFSFTYYY